jgi:hypothetical protein
MHLRKTIEMRLLRPTSMKPLGASLRAWGRARDGAVAVTVAVMIVVLVGVLALAVDVGRIYNASSDLNHAADAYALAGAALLDGQDDACLQAIQIVNEAALANQETFGSNEPDPVVFVSPTPDPVGNPNIKFLSELVKDADGNVTGTYITDGSTCGEDAKYIEITLDLADSSNPYRVDLYFAGITGALTEAFPQGYAIAESVTAFCITVPMMMCALDGHPLLDGKPFIEALENFELTGNGLYLKSVNQNQQWGSGNFGFLDLGQGPLCDYIGPIRAEPQCLTDGEIFTKTGSTSGARHCFNTRYDIWQGPAVGSIAERNYQPSANGVKGLIRRGPSCAYTGAWGSGQGYNDPPTPYTGYGSYGGPPSQATLPPNAAMPPPRDKCSYDDDCEGFQGRMGDGEWDRATYMEVNHFPDTYAANDMNFSVTDDNGTWDLDWPRGPHPDGQWSRYEMYLWELDRPYDSYTAHGGGGGGFGTVGPANPSRLPDNTAGAGGPDPIPQVGEYGGGVYANGNTWPQCYIGPMGTGGSITDADFDRDRRVERILVVNCDPATGGVIPSGKTEIPVSAIQGTMEVFLLEPWKVVGGVHEISTEIIGPGGAVIDDKFIPDDLKKEWVQLKEGRNALK